MTGRLVPALAEANTCYTNNTKPSHMISLFLGLAEVAVCPIFNKLHQLFHHIMLAQLCLGFGQIIFEQSAGCEQACMGFFEAVSASLSKPRRRKPSMYSAHAMHLLAQKPDHGDNICGNRCSAADNGMLANTHKLMDS